MEERISSDEDAKEELDSSVKENIKSNKSLTPNIQRVWDTMKRPNLRIIGMEVGEVVQLKSTGNIFNKIIEENFSQPKESYAYGQKKLTEHQIDWIKKKFPCHIIIKTLNIQNKEIILRASKEKGK